MFELHFEKDPFFHLDILDLRQSPIGTASVHHECRRIFVDPRRLPGQTLDQRKLIGTHTASSVAKRQNASTPQCMK